MTGPDADAPTRPRYGRALAGLALIGVGAPVLAFAAILILASFVAASEEHGLLTVIRRFLTVLAAAAAVTGVLVALVLLVVGVWHLLAAVYCRFAKRARAVPLRVGLGELLAAAALAAVPFVTTGIAERDDWVDRDGNGMLDGFANGAYDWLDINGGRWIRAWGLVNVLLGLAMWAATRWWRARGRRDHVNSA